MPAVLLFTGARLWYVSSFDTANERIHALHAVLNPDKLEYIRRQVGTHDQSKA
jgi:hypothetical protein